MRGNLDPFPASLSPGEMKEFSLNKGWESMRTHVTFPRKRGLAAGQVKTYAEVTERKCYVS